MSNFATFYGNSLKINYDEAVAVISGVKVVDGYTDGSFNPQGQLTRGAAAKIICNLILTPTTAAELPTNVAPYKDVAANSTFAGYIAYCQEKKIISGYNDGTFRPGAPLTSYAFMKMLLGALGYDQTAERFTGPNWGINVAKLGLGIGLNAGLKGEFVGTKPVTREEAALYAFNTLKATMVEYPEKTTVNTNGVEVVLAGARKDVAWGVGTKNDGKVEKDGFVQFAERYFEKLTREDDTDDFGRPANTWSYDKKDIGTYVDYTLLVAEHTTEVEGGDIYADITSAAADYTLNYYQDGVQLGKDATKAELAKIAKKNDDVMGKTGNGVLTQVFVDKDAEELTIVEINTYLAETDDYNEKKETLKINEIYGYANAVKGVKVADVDYTLELEDFASIEKYKDGDLVLVTIANGEIQSIADPETVKGTEIEEFSKHDYVVADEKYAYAKTGAMSKTEATDGLESLGYDYLADYDKNNLNDVTFDLYLDANGYLIGIKQVEDDVEYVFITGYDEKHSSLANKPFEANAIFSDGTTKLIKVDRDSEMAKVSGSYDYIRHNTWYTYTVKNDVYTLEYAKNQLHQTTESSPALTEINSKHVAQFDGTNYRYGNADTNYIVAKLGDVEGWGVITGVESVTTGVKNVSLDVWTAAEAAKESKDGMAAKNATHGVFSVYEDGYVVASIVIGDDGSISDRFGYLFGEPKNEKYNKTEDVYTWKQDAVIGGKVVEVTFKSDLPAKDSFTQGLYKMSYDKDGFVVDAVKASHGADYQMITETFNPDKTEIMIGSGASKALDLTAEGDTLWITAQDKMRGYAMADECPAVIVEMTEDGDADKYTEYTTVGKAIRALDTYNKGHANFDGEIYLFFKDGILTSVILTDTVEKEEHKNEGATVDGLTVTVDADALEIAISGKVEDGKDYDKTVKAAIGVALKDAGYQVASFEGLASGSIEATKLGEGFHPVSFSVTGYEKV